MVVAKRSPTNSYQNFYQSAQNLTADSAIDQTIDFSYLAFDASSFASTEASSISDLTINLAATAAIIDLTDTAIGGDRLVIASLYTQSIGQDTFSNSASLICRFTGTNRQRLRLIDYYCHMVLLALQYQNKKHKYPLRRISSDLMGRFVTT